MATVDKHRTTSAILAATPIQPPEHEAPGAHIMRIACLPMMALALACLLIQGCSTGDPDFCSMLSLEAVMAFDAGIV